MTKILYITTVPQTLGFFTGQIGFMKAKGFEVHALSSPGDYLDRFAETEGISVHAVVMPRRITPLHDLVALFQIWRKLKEIRPQIVHANTPKGGLLGMLAAWIARTPVRIYHIHGLVFMTSKGLRRALLHWLEKVSCSLSQQVFCVSDSVRNVTIEEGLCPAPKINVPLNGSVNGVDASERFNPDINDIQVQLRVRGQYEIPDNAIVVGFVGRIVFDKGLVELVEAWKNLREEFPRLHLLIVGSFEPQDPVPINVYRQLQDEDAIHLTGYQDDTPPLYSAMDILVLPSHREGFGMAALEASAMELPVVATRIAGCVDAVQENVTGILVMPSDVRELANAIKKYLQDPGLRHKHGKAGRARALQDFQPEAIWKIVFQEYVRLLREKNLSISM